MIGALLAGGAGRRLGSGGRGKATRTMACRPLVSYPAAALAAVCERVVVVCKADTALPEQPEIERWNEPAEPRHPVAGIIHALVRAREPVLVCAADMPFVTPEACRSLITLAARAKATATVALAGEILQPLFGVYTPAALDGLRQATLDAPLTETVSALDPARLALPERLVRSINTPADLAAAEAVARGG